MSLHIGESYDSFRKLRQDHAYYVDKTQILQEYLVDRFKEEVLFARPRRFGKTMTMTMFREFLDIRQNSRELFEGLAIMEHQDTVRDYMNQYPVIFLSMKEIHGKTYSAVLANLRLAVSNLLKEFEEDLTETLRNSADQEIYTALEEQRADEANTVAFLALLARLLHQRYQKPVFILVDEYDVPMAKALGTQDYDLVRDMVEHMLSYVCKTNEHVKAVMLSGCLYTVKNSTYTGVNNIIPYTVLSPLYASAIGFTDDEVKKLLSDAGLSDHYETVREWYDGYLFGREKMYCPWDVLRYVSSVLDGSYSEAMGPESYWVNTSETSLDVIHGFLGKTPDIMSSFEQLLAGKTVDCVVSESLPYHRIHENGNSIWSAMLETGYLTKAVTERMQLMPLRIPNRGIQDVFRTEVWDYFEDRVENATVRDLVNALWAGETGQAEKALNQLLEATLSFYHEYHEYSYHLILDGFFTGFGYRVLSELETGYGRSDLIILDPARNRCLILELKHVQEEGKLQSVLKEGTSQLIAMKYESSPTYYGYTKRLKYTMAFWKKKGLIYGYCQS